MDHLTILLENLEVEKKLNEALSGFVYDIPKEPETLLFDFYMSTLLEPSKLDDNLDYSIDETKRKLYPYMKQHMLDAVWFSIVCEFYHIVDSDITPAQLKWALEEPIVKRDIFRMSHKSLPDFFIKTLLVIYDLYKHEARGSYQKRNDGINKGIKGKITREDFVRTAEFFFSKKDLWHSGYGGKSWARISKAWLNLNQAKTLNEIMIWIDHIYDLQHNTGSVFTKVKKYLRDSDEEDGLRWLLRALEIKKNLKNPYEIWDDISPKMRELAGFALKKKKGTTAETSPAFGKKSIKALIKGKIITFVEHPNPGKEIIKGKYYKIENPFGDKVDYLAKITSKNDEYEEGKALYVSLADGSSGYVGLEQFNYFEVDENYYYEPIEEK